MDHRMKADSLRRKILAETAEYCRLVHGRKTPFRPGETKINYAGRVFGEKEMMNLVDSALEFWLTGGRYTVEFESRFAAKLGVKHALLVNSGSSANLLAFMALTQPELGKRAIHRGDEVITVAAAFPTTVAPVVQFGAVPVFCDVESGTANLDVSLLARALSPKTKAVFLAHTLGNPFDLAAVAAFCRAHSLWLIEDNCDSLGSKFAGKFTGAWGDIATSSFYPPHHITMGEGGAVYTNSDRLAKILRSLRDWGRDCHCPPGMDNACGHRFSGKFGTLPRGYDHKYVYRHFGYNLKATDLQAAVGCAQLDRLDSFTAARRRNFKYLFEGLSGLNGVLLPEKHPLAEPSWFGFLIRLAPKCGIIRNELVRILEEKKIQTRNLFAGNLTRHPCFAHLSEGTDYRIVSPLKNTDFLMNHAFWIGVYPGMDSRRLDFMISAIRSAVKK